MKKIIIATCSLLLASTTISCDNYLDILPQGTENSENYFNSKEDYDKALIGVYDLLATTYLSNALGEIASDNSLSGGANATDVLAWQQIDEMIHTPDNDALRSVFQWMYAGISRANFILEFKDKTNFKGKEQVIAETKFLRSYYYFELVKFFGDVPMYLDKRITIEEAQQIDRTPKAEVYAQLERDLLASIPNLPVTAGQKGRVTRAAAQALLGKIYLYQNKFSESAKMLQTVINSGQFQLVSDYNKIFGLKDENNSESVFEVQYIGTEGAGFGCLQCSEGNVAVGFFGPRFTGGDYAPYADGFSFNVPTKELYNLYSADDKRRDATIFNIDAFALEKNFTYTKGYKHTGYFNKKYIPYAEGNAGDPHLTHSNNYRAIRYSDVLLMAAEAISRANLGDAIAQDYLNQVRNRAGLPSVTSNGANLTEAIWNERRLELAGEGHRFFDQVRTGKTSTIQGFTVGKNEVFPIPRIEIELAGNRWKQNPGY